MSDTWYDYLHGTPEQQAADAVYQRQQYEAARNSPAFQYLRRQAYSGEDRGYDPRAAMYSLETPDGGVLADTLYPRRTSDAAEDAEYAADYFLEAGKRPRDTAVIGTERLSAGDPLAAAGYYARALPSIFYPPAAAGTPGSPDDWREKARRQGVSEINIMAFDELTDPENWVTAPFKGPLAFVPLGVQMKSLGALRGLTRADDVMDAMRYGRGIRTELIDRHGDVIRRLQSSRPAQRMGLPAPAG